ncbi:MAG: ATP-binding protein [Bacilli bacterium]|nr:ATP-binding protein [Bacilli bacterium]
MNVTNEYFKVSSSVKKILGRELITDKNVAIFELVKNSYDAMAKNVKVLVSNEEIVILDDGSGMSKDDVLNKWLFLGYSEKSNATNIDGRAYVGSKGIGRFACDRLGRTTKIITKKVDERKEHVLIVDWDKFEKTNKEEFQKIPVNFYEQETDSEQSYTRIEVTRLRDEWKEEEAKTLERLFYKLIDPFESRYSINVFIKFFDNEEQKVLNNLVNALQHVTVSIKVRFDESICVELLDRGTLIYKLDGIKNDTLLKNVKIQLTYLNRTAKIRFKANMGISCVEYGNVLVYKNGFRIYPIGNPDSDFFGLEPRKNQGFKRFLGNREIIGAISIEDFEDKFVEVSSRDGGFLQNMYTEELKKQYFEYAQKPLELYVNAIKWGYSIVTDEEITFKDVDLDENMILPRFAKDIANDNKYINPIIYEKRVLTPIENIDKLLANDNPTLEETKETLFRAKEVLTYQKKEVADAQKQLQKQEKQTRVLTRQNQLLRNLTNDDALRQAEITHHISKYSKELEDLSNDLINIIPRNEPNIGEIYEKVAAIVNIASRLKVFYKIVLNSNIRAKNDININIFEYFSLYINDLNLASSKRTKANLAINKNFTLEDEWNIVCDPYELSVIIDNMYANAKELGAKYLDILFTKENNKRVIIFTSDTPHIDDDKKDKIFELGYSTKDGGSGIGLYNIKKIINERNWHIMVDNNENSSLGVSFTISLE